MSGPAGRYENPQIMQASKASALAMQLEDATLRARALRALVALHGELFVVCCLYYILEGILRVE